VRSSPKENQSLEVKVKGISEMEFSLSIFDYTFTNYICSKDYFALYVQVYLQPPRLCPFFGFIYFKNYLFICIFLNLYKIDLSFVKSS
jgi:hypothetical protein